MNTKEIYEKYKDVILYLFFGVCTTLINVVSYWGLSHLIGLSVMISTIVAWLVAVLFAFFTNRKWVFHSMTSGCTEIGKELLSFFSCRLITGCVDWGCMFLFVDILKWDDLVIKFLANIAVIILNYMASKLIIFKREK